MSQIREKAGGRRSLMLPKLTRKVGVSIYVLNKRHQSMGCPTNCPNKPKRCLGNSVTVSGY